MTASASAAELPVVLLVEDDALMLRALERCLQPCAFQTASCTNALEAIERIRKGNVSVLVSDIGLPGTSGLELLSATRSADPDLPVILLTGQPSVESASRAIEYGVFRYLSKPFDAETLRSAVVHASRLGCLARLKREALAVAGFLGVTDRRALEVSFERALDVLWLAFQPIVCPSTRSVFGYEALLRTDDPELRGPAEMLDAAERIGALDTLGRRVREYAAKHVREANTDKLLFVNLHPRDLLDPELGNPRSSLAQIADRVVLEITERASLGGIADLKPRVAALRALGFRIAVDDLGAGYAGLASFAVLEPEIVKLDMTLTRDVNQSPVKQKLIASMAALCREMGMTIVVEGVETVAERDTLVELGCDLFQGYLFARPARAFPEPTW
jgi:EAL domain-containing protein (putative c-di-GMP-specific phosphodiesterase class I)